MVPGGMCGTWWWVGHLIVGVVPGGGCGTRGVVPDGGCGACWWLWYLEVDVVPGCGVIHGGGVVPAL